MSSKKPEFANSVRTAGTSETGRDRRVLAVPRAWLGALTLLLVVPWVAVIAFYFAGAPRRVVVEPVTPPPPAHSAAPGPWGLLTVAPIVVSPPLEYVGADWGGWRQGPAEWYFPGASPETLEAFLLTAGMSREQVAPILSSSRVDPGSGGLVVTPDPDLVRGLTPELRAHLYLQLAKTTRNYDQANAFRFFGATTDEWLRGSLMSPDSRRLIEPLIYRDGAFLRFSDVELLRSQIHDPAELRRIAKTLLRESTMLVRLTVNDGSEVAGLAEYWGRGGRRTDIRPLLESVANAGSDRSIDIVHLLPAFARNHLYRYPRISTADLNKPLLVNCLWTSLNFFQSEPDDRFLDVSVALESLRRDHFVVESGFQLGDIVAFLDEEGDLFHVAVYVADDLVFSKNGTSPVAPWVITPVDRLKAYYHTRSASPRLIYHRRNDL
ncbi:MAG: hypothetical protein A3H96_01450 [Acidobacteria bacterium RIFCSPLOWO2_02_FULL_67_36]|nr:MAG: hypothetical protein A3H96_01450 [Acidobacteria bacterium RIFCSPLOWO2_02_FULL_67_36]OFW26209.1 MAG: hypothetical protein A3G21_20745 [Acidobacteria bacterium RIFCSPLOWO2_12_FULL_66_21]